VLNRKIFKKLKHLKLYKKKKDENILLNNINQKKMIHIQYEIQLLILTQLHLNQTALYLFQDTSLKI
jgi:hypothetical protein